MFMPKVRSSVVHVATILAYQRNPREERSRLCPPAILADRPPGKTPPLEVLELLINLCNNQHTAYEEQVSFKTQYERARFLRCFFRDLQEKAGFRTLPDPRNLDERHVRAVAAIWQQEKLSPATIQTYLSFLRGFAQWIGKPGLIRQPQYYGFTPEEYKRSTGAEHDRSWSAQGIDTERLIGRICEFDRYVGGTLCLIRMFALSRKEALMLRPHRCIVPFQALGLPLHKKEAELYVCIEAGTRAGRERFIALDTPERIAAIEQAQLVATRDGDMGNPSRSLKQNLERFGYVLGKFGVTSNGLRQEVLIEEFQKLTGHAPPVRGGARPPRYLDKLARRQVAELAGCVFKRTACAYLGAVRKAQSQAGPSNEGQQGERDG